MQTPKKVIRRTAALMAVLAVTAILMPCALLAQGDMITLPVKELSAYEVFNAIQKQTDYYLIVNHNKMNNDLSVKVSQSPVNIFGLLDQLFSGSVLTYTVEGKFIHIPTDRPLQQAETVSAAGSISGIVTDRSTGIPVRNAEVVIGDSGLSALTDRSGNFRVGKVPPGTYSVAFHIGGHPTVYRDVHVCPGLESRVPVFIDNRRADASPSGIPAAITVLHPDSATIVPGPAIHSTASRVFISEYPDPRIPRLAVKTNLVRLASTTPNLSLELRIGRRWSIDVSAGLNTWNFDNNGKGFRHVAVRPEIRYWFCRPFEKHFLGLHAAYINYQIVDMNIPMAADLRGLREDGKSIVAGLSYGYDLPVSARWNLEFSAGAGFAVSDCKRYTCGTCSTYEGRHTRHYWGLTNAAVSLVLIIK